MNNFSNIELEELYNKRRDLQERKDNYFGGEDGFDGDRGYQDLWEELNEVNAQIDEIESNR